MLKEKRRGKEHMSLEILRNEYLRGGVTYRELSEKYAISLDRIKKAASRGKWREARDALENEDFRRRGEAFCEKAPPQEAPPAFSGAEIPVPERLRVLSGRVEEILSQVCSDRKQFFRHLLKDKNSEREYGEYVFRKADTKALVDITAAIKNLAAGCRDLAPGAHESASGGVVLMPEILFEEEEEAQEE